MFWMRRKVVVMVLCILLLGSCSFPQPGALAEQPAGTGLSWAGAGGWMGTEAGQ